ncbi:MAG: Lrp/AsnC family transcriptional regulator [Candidatus Thermoplasmatota archaeon]|nr:Lrp/AsnC family transcriptional regulator [Candidatus Thermoplasmatota archaeon]
MKAFRPDALDLRIVEIMEKDCSLGYREVAEKLGKNIWNVRDRIIHLKDRGIIKKCKADVNYSEMGLKCRALLSFNLPAENIDPFISFTKSENMFKRLIITTGQRRFHLEAVAEDCNDIRLYAMRKFPDFKVYDVEFEVVLDNPL